MDYIEEVKNYLLKHLSKISAEKRVAITDTSVRFSLNRENNGVVFANCCKYVKFENTTLKDIMKLRLDVFSKAAQVEQFIYRGLNFLCVKENISITDIYVFAVPDNLFQTFDEENNKYSKERLAVHVYKGGTPLKKISVQEFVFDNVMEELAKEN